MVCITFVCRPITYVAVRNIRSSTIQSLEAIYTARGTPHEIQEKEDEVPLLWYFVPHHYCKYPGSYFSLLFDTTTVTTSLLHLAASLRPPLLPYLVPGGRYTEVVVPCVVPGIEYSSSVL